LTLSDWFLDNYVYPLNSVNLKVLPEDWGVSPGGQFIIGGPVYILYTITGRSLNRRGGREALIFSMIHLI